MSRLAKLVLAVAALPACSIGAPPGFSSGDSWTVPLVGPLEDGLLVVPVFVQDKGPYLFGVDPDAPTSQIDEALVSELSLHNGLGPKVLDETDTNRPSHLAEVLAFRIGSLTVRNRTVMVMKVGSFGAGGRQLRGVLGRDVIADSLVFGFDRDRGTAFLATQKGFTPPASATPIGYGTITNRLTIEMAPVTRRVAKIEIDGHGFDLHLDLGAVTSQLRRSLWDKAGLSSLPVESDLRDEVGTVHHTTEAGVANTVAAGALTASGVLFVPYQDKRWEDEDVDGTVGLNFFRTVNVAANWDAKRYYLTPRGDVLATAKERIGRWQSDAIAACEHLGCVSIEMIEPAAAAPVTPTPTPAGAPGASGAPGAGGPPGAGAPAVMPPEPRPVVVLHRDAAAQGLAMEVVLAAVDGSGAPAQLPYLVVNLPAELDQASNQLDPTYRGQQLVVVDLSPYPRPCPRPGAACVQAFAPTH